MFSIEHEFDSTVITLVDDSVIMNISMNDASAMSLNVRACAIKRSLRAARLKRRGDRDTITDATTTIVITW